jgi:ATP adenylyltransferase
LKAIFTPWRYEYVKSVDEREGCIFCEKPSEPEEMDRQNLVLLRGNACFAILNLYPYSSGHVMIAPYEHTRTIEGLPGAVLEEMMTMVQRCMKAVREAYTPDGFNVGINIARVAGAGIDDHVHMHVVPRWAGDANFMPVVAGVKVLPLTLDDVWARLVELL